MKYLFSLLLVTTFFSSCIYGQIIKEIPLDTNVKLRDIFWKINKDQIYNNYEAKGEYFYKAIIIQLSEGESNLEGEVLDRLYLLKGEYGEYPDGKLYDLGTRYHITSVDFINNSLVIKYKEYIGKKNKTDTIKLSDLK